MVSHPEQVELAKIIKTIWDEDYRREEKLDVQDVFKLVELIEKATVKTKKISVSKMLPSHSKPSALTRRGVWGYPNVSIVSGPTVIKICHQLAATPLAVSYDIDHKSGAFIHHYTDHQEPEVPEVFIGQLNQPHFFRGHVRLIGKWLVRNCPAVIQLDQSVQAAWQAQVDEFPAAADLYIEKFGDKQRELFQAKLLKQLSKHKCGLENMSPSHVFEIFKLARDHHQAVINLVSFCKRNQVDAAFIDESDIEMVFQLMKVRSVQNS